MICAGAGLSVAPLTMYEHGKSKGRGDYEDYRADVEYRGEMEDPYARVVYRNRIQTSQSGSRLHPQGTILIDKVIVYHTVSLFLNSSETLSLMS